MDYRPKYKKKTIKLPEDKTGENLDFFWYGDDFI